MSRSRREKNPNLTCRYTWGGTPELDPVDSGWSCPHVCHLPIDHDGDHYCCGTRARGD
jgi:hypothetical protein